MHYNKEWEALKAKAEEEVSHRRFILYLEPYLQVELRAHGQNPFSFRIHQKDNFVQWSRTIWDEEKDGINYHPFQNSKQSVIPAEPTIIFERGTIATNEVKQFFDFAQSIAVPPLLKPVSGLPVLFPRYKLYMGVQSSEMVFKWSALPQGWHTIQQLADMLFKLNDTLTPE